MDDTTHGDIPSKPAKKGSWLKENPTLVKLGLLGVLVVVLLVLVAVQLLGSGGRKPGRPRPPSTASAAAPTAPPAPPAGENDPPTEEKAPDEAEGPDQPGEQPEKPQGKTAPKGKTVPREQEKPKRPEEIADWKKDDYFSARVENDPRLVEAVGYLGKLFAGKGSAARMLANLLAPPQPEEEGGRKTRRVYRRPARQGGPTLIEAVVAAIHINGSEETPKIFEELLAGKRETEDDVATVEATLNLLADHPCPKYDALLFRALTAAEEFRPGAEGDLTAEDLRQTTLELVESSASGQFRTELATYLVKPATPPEQRKTMGEFLQEDDPDNLGAQLVLYRSDETVPQTKLKLEEYFTGYSSEAMAKMLGVSTEEVGTSTGPSTRRPPPRRPPPRRSPSRSTTEADAAPADPDLPYRVARQLWSPQFAAMIQGRLGELESLQKQTQVVTLGSTIPVESVRSTLLKKLHEHWADGPASFDSGGLPDKVISDPGFLVVMKTLVRQPATIRASGKDAREKIIKTKEDWQQFSDRLVRAWCERFRAAAAARAEAAPSPRNTPGENPPAMSLPIALPTGTDVSARYHLNWSSEVQSKLPGVTSGPMEIHYFRIEQKSRPVTALGYYKRQLRPRTRDVRRIDQTDWIESFRSVPENGRKRSIDVLITSLQEKVDPAAKKDKPMPAAKEAEDLVIDILSIETQDPENGPR